MTHDSSSSVVKELQGYTLYKLVNRMLIFLISSLKYTRSISAAFSLLNLKIKI